MNIFKNKTAFITGAGSGMSAPRVKYQKAMMLK